MFGELFLNQRSVRMFQQTGQFEPRGPQKWHLAQSPYKSLFCFCFATLISENHPKEVTTQRPQPFLFVAHHQFCLNLTQLWVAYSTSVHLIWRAPRLQYLFLPLLFGDQVLCVVFQKEAILGELGRLISRWDFYVGAERFEHMSTLSELFQIEESSS